MARLDFRTTSDFRKRRLAALAGLFMQVLALCRQAGLVQLGHVATGRRQYAPPARRSDKAPGRSYRLSKQTVEPVVGQVKQARAFPQCLLVAGLKLAPNGRWCAPRTT